MGGGEGGGRHAQSRKNRLRENSSGKMVELNLRGCSVDRDRALKTQSSWKRRVREQEIQAPDHLGRRYRNVHQVATQRGKNSPPGGVTHAVEKGSGCFSGERGKRAGAVKHSKEGRVPHHTCQKYGKKPGEGGKKSSRNVVGAINFGLRKSKKKNRGGQEQEGTKGQE